MKTNQNLETITREYWNKSFEERTTGEKIKTLLDYSVLAGAVYYPFAINGGNEDMGQHILHGSMVSLFLRTGISIYEDFKDESKNKGNSLEYTRIAGLAFMTAIVNDFIAKQIY